MIKWSLVEMSISELRAHPRNPRELSKHDHQHLKKSLDKFGLIDKPIINTDGQLIGGHQRIKVLEGEGIKLVQCWKPDRFLTDKEVDELCVRLNRNTGEWDWDILADQWDMEQLLEWGFKQDEFGVGELDIDQISSEEPEDEAPELPKNPISVIGDIIDIDGHRLACGDCTHATVIDKLFGGQKVDMLLTDPPYGVDYSSKNEALNKVGKGNRNQTPILNDALSDYRKFFSEFLSVIPMADYNTCYVAMSGQELHNVRLAMEDCGFKWGDYLVWVKNNHVLSRKDYNAKHEFIVYGWKGKHKFYGPTNATTIIECEKPQQSKLHPTMKPVKLMEQMLEHGSAKGAIVYDAFTGSGTTLMACASKGRIFRGCELSPAYCDVIVKRYIEFKHDAVIKLNGEETDKYKGD